MAFAVEALIYIDFANTVDFKEKQKVPHSYSRAEENARFVTEFGMTRQRKITLTLKSL